MKYLRRYSEQKSNEALTTEQELALHDLCDAHFAYLYDEGFEVNITGRTRTNDRHIQSILSNTYLGNQSVYTTYIITLSSRKSFQLEDVKDYFEGLLDSLKKNNVNIYGISVKGISHYSFSSNHVNNLDFITNKELVKVNGMTMTINTPSAGKQIKQTLTSVSVEVLEYDLAKTQALNESKDTFLDLDQLRDFCEGNLVYLLDDGFEVSVRPKQFKLAGLIYNKILVRVMKPYREPGSTLTNLTSFRITDEFKDYVIPFLQRIKSNYDVVSIVFGSYLDALRSTRYKNILINDVNEIESLSGYISCVDIEIRDVEKQVLKESYSGSEEDWIEFKYKLQDYCDSNLVYLLDEGIEVYINPQKSSNKFLVSILKRESNGFHLEELNLDEIKDYIIPFLKRIKQEYNVKNILITNLKSTNYGKIEDYPSTAWLAYHKINNPDELDKLSGTLEIITFEVLM
jgi:hypothetical protein